ncbi:class C beta-lactamase-related serine hydrolase [Fulvimarina endophytica]|uniref:Class C beta-lactamase-related serine hydrolase n=1 Tax=Fulvimarina endophytica TaxID=2293836 RepID=A0A371X2E0_9HYPH|nr:serine hydrolase [Fulvimarina endophytica]RFC63390.1 class C beta-lactamase-related serine hydrolase [Fulvimarina endophytica]
MNRRHLLQMAAASAAGLCLPAFAQDRASGPFADAIARAGSFANLRTMLVAVNGETLVDEGFGGYATNRPANIKSASKSLISLLVGIAIDKGLIENADQPIADFLEAKFPPDPDPRLEEITIGNLLSMQAGLERTSGANYGAWIASRDWVADALSRPFVDEPGGSMLYSTGSTHLLSAVLTRASGRPTREIARDWLAGSGIGPIDFERDPQGIDLGGNQTAMTPRSLLNLGELYRRGGVVADGTRIVSQDWIEASWTPRTRSRFHAGRYGYGWFIERFAGEDAYYGWGYGGQMIYVVPSLELTVAITSDETVPSGRTGYREDLHALVSQEIIPAARATLDARAGGDAGSEG